MAASIIGWHFAADRLRDGRPLPRKGDTLKHDGAVVLCQSGLHASVRAIDALLTLDSIDPARIAVCGGSQGGGIALAVGGIDPRVAALLPDVPFLCDFPRALRMAAQNPYLEILRYLAQHRDQKARVMETLAYFDGVNFARFAKAKALFSVALMDDVCPPSTVYGAFNAYRGEKTMVEYEFNNHEGGQAFQVQKQLEWLSAAFGMN